MSINEVIEHLMTLDGPDIDADNMIVELLADLRGEEANLATDYLAYTRSLDAAISAIPEDASFNKAAVLASALCQMHIGDIPDGMLAIKVLHHTLELIRDGLIDG